MVTDMLHRFTKSKRRWLERADFTGIIEVDNSRECRPVLQPNDKKPLLLFSVVVDNGAAFVPHMMSLVWNGGRRYAWALFSHRRQKFTLCSDDDTWCNLHRLGPKDIKVLQAAATDIEKSLMTETQ
jgi:hypothetical protein